MPEREPRPPHLERVPAELKQYDQWVNWHPAAARKVPLNPHTRGHAGVNWPATWASYAHALENANRHALGLGFVLTPEDPYLCVDLDHCVGTHGEVSAPTRALLDLLAGYVELSPSGTGLHIWVKSAVAVNRRRPELEIYASGRWMTMTGRHHPQAPPEIPERTDAIVELVHRYFPGEEQSTAMQTVRSDDELWQTLFASAHGLFFQSLFRGDITVAHNDPSRAVILLANQLARMTDLDAVRVKRLLYQTNLVRPKWEERRGSSTWLDQQILNAIRYVARHK